MFTHFLNLLIGIGGGLGGGLGDGLGDGHGTVTNSVDDNCGHTDPLGEFQYPKINTFPQPVTLLTVMLSFSHLTV